MNDELKVSRLSCAARPFTFQLSYALAACALLLFVAQNAAAQRPRRKPTPLTHLEGVRVHYQRGGAHRSVVFWTDSYKKQDLGRTDLLLRERLTEAGYPVRW